MEAQLLRRLFTVDEFHQMADAGVFREDDRLELLDGEIVRMTPIGNRHAACVKRLNQWLVRHALDAAIVGVQDPITLSADTEVYPDLALLKRRADFYSNARPQPADVLLVIEVADTTGDYDRRMKVPQYARAGIPEVWIVDLRDGIVDVYRQPMANQYREQMRRGSNESLVIPGVAGAQIAVSAILG